MPLKIDRIVVFKRVMSVFVVDFYGEDVVGWYRTDGGLTSCMFIIMYNYNSLHVHVMFHKISASLI